MSALSASPNSVTPYAAPALDPARYQWPVEGPSRAPYWTFTDPMVYAREQERIFRGKVWHYVGLEAEVANPGDFKATQIGESPVLITRGEDGKVYGMLNRCAHRGNLVSMKENGNTKEFYCVYHAWVYNLKGDLTSAAFRRGIRGEGGLPADFKLEEHGLQKLKVETFHGLVFASFALDMEPLADWLGEVGPGIERVMKGKVRVLGYDTQRIASNWKNYHENPRDSYHAQILHSFCGTFGLSRQSQESGMILASSGRHQYFYTKAGTEKNSADYKETADKLRSTNDGLRLEDPSILNWKDEYGDGVSIQILSVYPSFVLHQIAHSLTQWNRRVAQMIGAVKSRQSISPCRPKPAAPKHLVEFRQIEIHHEQRVSKRVQAWREAPVPKPPVIKGAVHVVPARSVSARPAH